MGKGFEQPKGVNVHESPNFGKEVRVQIQFQRHGIRSGMELTPEGREITQEAAIASGRQVTENPQGLNEYHVAKAIGSSAGTPEPTEERPKPLGRALETAHITSGIVAGDRVGTWKSRIENRLDYEKVLTPPPYDHLGIYNPALAEAVKSFGKESFDELTKDEKVAASEVAQTVVMKHLGALDSPEALTYKQEIAGAFADLIEHYSDMTDFLKNGSKVLINAGTHGGSMEHILQQALVWTDEQGKQHIGTKTFDEFGGGFQSSDSYVVSIETDENKELKEVHVQFDNPKRPQGELTLDLPTVHKLAAFYRDLHMVYKA